jgi:hypothetical protein
VPQFQLFLPHLRRAAAVLLTFAALGAVASSALAAGSSASTGGTTAGSAPAKPKRVSVKRIQRALGIKADGVMGPKTKRAIKRFQRAHGLKADGVAGPATLEALGLAGKPKNGTLNSTTPVNPDDVAAIMAQIAQCESGGDPTATSKSGTYRGKYQFTQETWESLGGTGDPAEAPENVQDVYAAALYNERGLDPWPACSAQIQADLDAAGAPAN